MKEYGILKYLELFKEYNFRTKLGVKREKVAIQDDVRFLNNLARDGWRVVSKEGNTYLMEKDVRRTKIESIN